jgi:hypothetical protein
METIHTNIFSSIPKFDCNGGTSLLCRVSVISTNFPRILSLQLLLFAGKKKISDTKYSEYSTKPFDRVTPLETGNKYIG